MGSSKDGPSPRVQGTHPVVTPRLGLQRSIPARAGNTLNRAVDLFRPDGPSPRVQGTPSSRRTVSGAPTVHPRACREHITHGNAGPWSVGPSPRVQGTRDGDAGEVLRLRSIPARAGNTPSCRGGRAARPVHPRACREHTATVDGSSCSHGPSPRVQGTLDRCRPRKADLRSIPARAGNTATRTTRSRPATVHPRACREHRAIRSREGVNIGPSPRVQGTPIEMLDVPGRQRSIPARAGNTTKCSRWRQRRAVHPRACREHPRARALLLLLIGPSPRVQGTPQHLPSPVPAPRSIPARAGNTVALRFRRHGSAVHPRACREHSTGNDVGLAHSGPSPRVQGTLLRHGDRPPVDRSIPARAGNTAMRRPESRRPTVHPRACREHPDIQGGQLGVHGPSPRVQGTLAHGGGGEVIDRSIPARAGNTGAACGRFNALSVHPRACREHPCRRAAAGPVHRSIPARAGNTLGTSY